MVFQDIVRDVAGALGPDGRAKVVFGEAVRLEHHTIVPVAIVAGGSGAERSTAARPFSGVVTASPDVRPVGFITEHGEDVVFTPIHVGFGLRRVAELALDAVVRFVEQRLARPAPSAVVVSLDDARSEGNPT